MDNRWKFLYQLTPLERRGDAGSEGERAAGRARPSHEAVVQANPHNVRAEW